MRGRFQVLTAVMMGAGMMATLAAQQTTAVHPGKGGSPHVRTDWTIDGAKISIEYGRPAIKGRPEAELMPPGQPWRTGADEATILTTDKPLKFGSVTLAPGTHTINTQPNGTEWQIIFGTLSKPGPWGVPYQPSLEKSRAPMKVGKAAKPVELLTISIDDSAAGATLRVEWGTTSATVPFTVG